MSKDTVHDHNHKEELDQDQRRETTKGIMSLSKFTVQLIKLIGRRILAISNRLRILLLEVQRTPTRKSNQ